MAATDDAVANRPKRVRTGCLTCRERHLKCDEGLPECQNCRKSSRTCKRGVRLNFIDTQVKPIPTISRSNDWRVSFQDESREIASDYAGGVARYAAFSQESNSPRSRRTPESISSASTTASMPSPHPTLPPILPLPPLTTDSATTIFEDYIHTKKHRNSDSYTQSTASDISSLISTTMNSHGLLSRSPQKPPARDFLDSQEKTLFMQVFVEEVGLWMDSLDPAKHFSRLLPFTALEEPMLLNAFLACGARHLTLVNPAFKEDKALNYYDTATRLLLNALQDLENRDMEICATTAVILNVYEIMSERATKRMNHIAGARALIQNCHWDARSTGVGGACFWLNVSMELLSCLHFNWSLGWDPDKWELDMSLERDPCLSGNEEKWAHKMVYILAKIANFRATVQLINSYEMQRRRYDEWKNLHNLCIAWNDAIPRSMHPMAYLYPYQTTHKSVFPEVWLIKRCTIVARLFFHTAMVLLAGINPTLPRDTTEMDEMAMQHAHQICGITAHVKDRGVASVALRSLAIAAECLTIRKEQEEVLQIFQKIKQETGWRVDFLHKELKGKWGWENQTPLAPPATLMRSAFLRTPTSAVPLELSAYQTHHTPQLQTQYQPTQQPQQQTQPPHQQPQYSQIRLPQMINPLIGVADGSNGHPYHPHYVPAPTQHIDQRNRYM
ncbi:hypothetical protein L211DRAFT_617693 [Terfezia boudieri ATCC MYA-4762]|uniref:Zn(2)-C6 fungal-type domain-containing protein n=1 Tax=Terfezia boudieri ATCC MYA-4762 TaxID=1051890 RepID=A0A3N4LZW9_9PEZI|nr:hypothetical protein L211DRAFT_617693 [Terfezia boudieri ATCC MYA-4762]